MFTTTRAFTYSSLCPSRTFGEPRLQKDEGTQAKDLCALQFKVNHERTTCSAGQSFGTAGKEVAVR